MTEIKQEAAPSEGNSIVRGTAIVSVLTLLSRILGFVRELLTARLLGTGFFSDAYFVAFRIPNLLRSFVAEGALTSAFVPLFASELAASKENAQRVFNNVAGFLITLTSAIAILGILYADRIVRLFGFVDDKSELCATLTQIMFPYLVCISLVAMLNGVLNSLKIYGTAAWAQIVMNVALIAGAGLGFLFDSKEAALILSWSVLVGGVIGVIYQFPAIKRAGLVFRPRFALFSKDIRSLLLLMIPAIFGAAVYQLSIFMATLLASLLNEGAVSWLFYADRLAQLPIGIFTVALASVLLPTLAKLHARGDHATFSLNLERALSYTSVLILPVAIVLYIFAEPIMIVLFEGGRFTRSSSINAASALKAMSIGLWGMSCHSIAVRAFLARKDTITPSVLGIFSLSIGLLLSLTLMGAPHVTSQSNGQLVVVAQQQIAQFIPLFDLGHVGLALSSSIASLITFFLMLFALMHRIPTLSVHEFTTSTFKAAVAATLSVSLVLVSDIASMEPMYQVALGIPLVFVSYFLIGKVLGLKEIQETFRLIGRRFSRP